MKTRTLFTVIIALTLVTCRLQAQRKWKDYLITGSAVFVSGMLDGTKESISYHYDRGFKRVFPKVNDCFWNPAISWKNKYKNGDYTLGPKFIGSTNAFVFATDAYHMLRTERRVIDGLVLAYYVNKDCVQPKKNKKKWKTILTDFAVLTAIRCIGFNVTYNLVFSQQKTYLTN